MGWRAILPPRSCLCICLHLIFLQDLFVILAKGFILDGSQTSFAQFPRWHAGLNGTLSLRFRTREPNGLLLYTDDGGSYDFFEVKLVQGNARLWYNLGGGTAIIAAGTNLHDSQWHNLTITRKIEETILTVDEDVQKHLTFGQDYLFGNATTNSAVFIGGLPAWYGSNLSLLALPSAFFEPRFQGSVEDVSFTSDDGILKPQELQVSRGIRTSTVHPQHEDVAVDHCALENPCHNNGICSSTESGPICDCRNTDYEGALCEQRTKCHPACANHGVCVEMWNRYTCDCDMTSFSGPICADESISYEFGPGTGLITFAFQRDKMPDTKSDMVALGFITMADSGVLVRIDSGSSNDYMELAIVDGNVFMRYNMGTEDHLIGEQSVHVNDGQYHVVKFTRSGPNSTIQVDDHNVWVKHPPGRQLTVFNSRSTIQVGGKTLRGAIERPFKGIISGLVVNGDRILDMTAKDDQRVSVRGDVELHMSPPLSLPQRSAPAEHQQMQQHAAASLTNEGDDLVYSSGRESGCFDDEDDCREVGSASGDDIMNTPKLPSGTSTRPPPRIVSVPSPDMTITSTERNNASPKVNTSPNADNTVIVVGIIASVLISVAIVALIVYRIRSSTLGANPGVSGYKAEEQKRMHFPLATGTASYQGQPVQHMTDSQAQNKQVKNPRKKEVVKDLKEGSV